MSKIRKEEIESAEEILERILSESTEEELEQRLLQSAEELFKRLMSQAKQPNQHATPPRAVHNPGPYTTDDSHPHPNTVTSTKKRQYDTPPPAEAIDAGADAASSQSASNDTSTRAPAADNLSTCLKRTAMLVIATSPIGNCIMAAGALGKAVVSGIIGGLYSAFKKRTACLNVDDNDDNDEHPDLDYLATRWI